ncbi:hypothetical protein [Paraglaciecola hydrolytica]|uniref:Uncharacterized protein n=1 Tax=Paraglaciecola hydrolytica TaxID=1799789 RepID=A0A136A190_9ALTE|nr:hypothetical protein [Paraglaciecola hydrolytica]KXI28973.1 hypothetical protein AX660_12415 [Paraglaciecola hydrolytica]
MGGRGSGSYSRYNSKPTTDNYLKLDLRVLKKRGWLTPNINQTLTWSRNDNVIGAISYVLSNDSITLLYEHGASSNEPESINDQIPLIKTSCNFGGERIWFCCPSCMRKALVLFGGKYFRCRICRGAIHPSVNENKLDRSRRALAKYQTILAPDKSLSAADGTRNLHKPKGMRYKTYFEIKKRASEKEDDMNQYFITSMKRYL